MSIIKILETRLNIKQKSHSTAIFSCHEFYKIKSVACNVGVVIFLSLCITQFPTILHYNEQECQYLNKNCRFKHKEYKS